MPSLTKKLRAGLLLLGGAMPEALAPNREIITGSELIARGTVRLKDGSKVLDSARYKVPGKGIPMNHGKRLCRAFERAGRAGVLAYCERFIEPEHREMFAAKLAELVPA